MVIRVRGGENNSDTFNPTNFEAGGKSDYIIIAGKSVELSFMINLYT